MGSTTIHIPDILLKKIDNRVRELGISRNRYVINACEEALEKTLDSWPACIMEPDLDAEDLAILRKGTIEVEQAIQENRKNKGAVLL